ncbi:cytochrome b/b6 domain-containing protein [Bosea sp. (in: a-proteobacteria)]|uniref:cytochrome b/b6 domain-containing protein n=1 Tax=Bosea sp. (in: a-proteobacteria) TaxID=1871050 RepID=UPI0025C0C715|nr:cytochrome b/b6 domain-containing protein [Bosea sp. (in: a-proteobacteria)]
MNKSLESGTALTKRSVVTKILHALLLTAVIFQLAVSLFMEGPRTGRSPDALFILHQYGGYLAAAALLAFWVWGIVRRGETQLGSLFPWFSRQRMAAIATDCRLHIVELRQLRLPAADDRPLASAVHGLGLSIVTLMALTGVLWATGWFSPASAELLIATHKASANLMWAYLVAHAGLAILHEFLGERVLPKMFGRNS